MAERHKTLAELEQACTLARAKGGEPPVLTLDNDETFACQENEGGHGECVFRMDPYDVLRQALDLLGIPHQEA